MGSEIDVHALVRAILTETSKGFTVEVSRGRDDILKVRTVQKKNVDISSYSGNDR